MKQKNVSPWILISGDAQAEALALVLSKCTPISSRFEVKYRDSRNEISSATTIDLSGCAFILEQSGSKRATNSLPKHCKRIVFPLLRLYLLWPLAAAAPQAHGKMHFAWGDAFIAACLRQGVAPAQVMQHYTAPYWSPSWPNLDERFKDETEALLAIDAKCDVKLSSYILKFFRKQRLFWAPTLPSNQLLAELAYRIIHACFGSNTVAERSDIDAAYQSIASVDVFSRASLPIHPLVAKHFGLEWYDANERYTAQDGVSRSFDEYYRVMIENAYGESVPVHIGSA